MAKSAKDIGKMVTTDVGKALANIGSMRPDIKADETVKAAAAPSRDMTFAERFKYERMAAKAAGLDPSKQTFTHNGKTYNTRMAGEGVKRPAAPTSGRSGTGASGRSDTKGPAVSAATSNFFKKLPTVGSTVSSMRGNPPAAPRANPPAGFKMDNRFLSAKVATPPPPVKKDDFKARLESKGAPNPQPTRAERMAAESAKNVAAYKAKQKAKTDAERAAKAKRENELKRGFRAATQGGAPLRAMAKGGSIDGCAIRGKTRAPMKKGK